MIEYRKELVESNIPIKAVCDRCGRDTQKEGNGFFEFQEFLSIRSRGGYGSVFGDGNDVECDICQHCLKELLGDVLRISSSHVEFKLENDEDTQD